MNVCFVAIDFHSRHYGGGIASYVCALGSALTERGHTVTVIANGMKREWCEIDGLRVFLWPMGSLHWYWYRSRVPSRWGVLPLREIEWSLSIRHALREVIQSHPVDVIEGCEAGNQFITQSSVPLIMRLHGEQYVFAKYSGTSVHMGLRLNRRLEYGALRRACAVSSPSRFQAQQVAQHLGWPSERVHVIPNPVAPWVFEDATRDRYEEISGAPRSDAPVVLYTGRIEHRKGTIPFLRSLPSVRSAFPSVTYVIAGARHNSIDDKILALEFERYKIRSHVKLLGHVPWQELTEWYRRATVFVMPSYYETFGISVVEAMAFGLPVVATTAGGLPEVVEDGVTGILVPPGEPEALAEGILCLLRDPKMRNRMGQAGRERVLAEFTVERVVESTLALYRTVMQ